MNKFSRCCLFLHFFCKNGQKAFTGDRCGVAAMIVIRRRHQQRVRRERWEWVQKWLLDRGYYGAVANLMKTQTLNDAAFQGFLRMNPPTH